MRKLKTSMLCLLLTAVLFLVLCACQSGDDYRNDTSSTPTADENADISASLVGSWEWKADITDSFNATLSEDVRKYLEIKELYYIFDLKFKEDGHYSLLVDEVAYREVEKNAIADIKEGLTNYLTAMLQADGIDMTVDAYMLSIGSTMDEYAQSLMKSLDPLLMGVNSSGYYKAENGKLYLGISPFFKEEDGSDFILDGDALTIKEGMEGLWDAMEFVRVK